MGPQPCLGHSQVWQSGAEISVKGITPCPPLGLLAAGTARLGAPGVPWAQSSSLQAHSIADFLAHILPAVQGFSTNSNIQHGKTVLCKTTATF